MSVADLSLKLKGAFYGHAIGDALGVPVEFKSRAYLQENPVVDFMGYMCWNQPPGTFSDDSSMMFCAAESLCEGYDLEDIAHRFSKWYQEGYWGAHDQLFDIGNTTRRSLDRVINGIHPKFSGDFFPEDNGNGSLMRILPLVFVLKDCDDVEERYRMVKEVSSITHAHFRSIFSCFVFVEFGRQLLFAHDKYEAYQNMKLSVDTLIKSHHFNQNEIDLFSHVLHDHILTLDESKISSMGYVLDSLESAIWCLMTTDCYRDSVLKAVNLGGDTDTTAAINGGIAGILYGYDAIPDKWIAQVAKRDQILSLADSFGKKYNVYNR